MQAGYTYNFSATVARSAGARITATILPAAALGGARAWGGLNRHELRLGSWLGDGGFTLVLFSQPRSHLSNLIFTYISAIWYRRARWLSLHLCMCV